jgi:copper(I)-binding protein
MPSSCTFCRTFRGIFRRTFRRTFRLIAGLTLSLSLIFSLGLSTPAIGADFTAGNIVIGHPYARATVPGQPTGGAYFSIENKGKEKDTLKSISSDIAKSTELHVMTMDGNIMKMREVDSVDIKPSEKIVMQPGGGYHIMLVGLNKPLKSGDQFPMTLTFAKGGKIVIKVDVEAMTMPAEKSGAMGAMQH